MTDATGKKIGLEELAREFARLEARATPGNLSTCELTGSEIGVECPTCQGEGYVDAESYTNFDGVAIGVQFFGVGDEHGAHEDLWRFFMKNRRAILSAISDAARVREWQPITTAPKTGTRVLLWWRTCKHPSIGYWTYDDCWDERKTRGAREGWISDGDALIPINQDDCTHWMPAPLAPRALTQAEPEGCKP